MDYERPPITFAEQFPDRDDREYQQQREENSSFLGMAEKLVAIGFGTKVLSKNVFKVDILGYAAHYLGKYYQDGYSAVASLGKSVARNPLSGKPARAVSHISRDGKIGAKPGWDLDIIDHINNSLDVLASPNLDTSVHIRNKIVKEAFERKYAQAIPHYYDTSLERLTVDKVLAAPKQFIDQFGTASFDAIKRGHDTGLLKQSFTVDPFLYRNVKSGNFIDTRLRSGKHLSKLLFNNINPLGVFRPVQDLFADPGVAIVPTGTKINSKITVKGRNNIYAFGEIFTLDEVDRGVIKRMPAKNIVAYKAGGSLHETIAIGTGQAEIIKPPTDTIGGWLQDKLGIGPAFANRRSLPSLLFRPFAAALSQAKKKNVVKIKPFTPSGASFQEEADAVLSTISGVVRESDTRAGSFPNKALFEKITDYWSKDKVSSRKERISNRFDYIKARLGFQSKHFELYKANKVSATSDIAVPLDTPNLTRDSLAYQRTLGPIGSLDKPLPKSPKTRATDTPAFSSLSHEEIKRIATAPIDSLSAADKATRQEIYSYRATTSGGITSNLYSQYGFADRATLAKSAPNFLALRLNALIGSTFGIGIKPSKNFMVNMGRVAAVPFLFQGALTSIDYADYLSQKFTGFSPINTAARTYTYAREKQQQLREKTGLNDFFLQTEKVAPGLLESGLGYLLRHGVIAASTLGLMLSGRGKLGLLAGLAGYTAIGGPNVAQSYQEIKDEYSGKRLVKVNKSRFWGFGRQPFEGGRLDYMAPSWYQRLLKRPYMSNIYGSRDAYYAKHANIFGFPFPSIESGFGLRQLLDPYRLEKETYYDRPYPVTGGFFKEIPIFGGMLDATIGQIIKPRRRMHGEFYNNQTVGVHTNLYSQHLPNQIGEKLGFGRFSHTPIEPTQAGSIKSSFEEISNQFTEPLGFYKFLAEKVLGILPKQSTFKEADSSAIGSTSRSFHDLQLGGLGGMTEFVRRFFLPEWGTPSKLNEKVNPIPNTQPSWLPGSRSEFMRDKFPWIDFHTGDPFTKLHGGEWRLPGTGYEKMFGLHSGQPGVYDEVDRFLVLNSVAPFSEAYLYYKIRALSKYNSGKLDEHWSGRVEQALEFEAEKKKRFDYYPRLFTKDAGARGNLLDFRRDLGEINAQTQFSGPERVLRAGWEILSHDVLQHMPYVGTKLAPFYSPLEHYKKFQLYGSEGALWDSPWSDIIRPAIYETAGAPAPMPFVKGAMLGAALGHPASPLRAFNPFPQGSALNSAGLISKFGIAGSALGWGKLLLTQDMESNFIPPHIERQRETEQYFDNLRYIKARMIEEKAIASGDEETASIYKREAASTFAGLTSDSTKSYMRRSLSRIDRAYFDAFTESPASERPAILKNVPEYVRPIYQKIWGMDSSLDNRTQNDADNAALQYLSSHVFPGKDSLVWHPDVPMQAIKSAFLDSGINGLADSFSKFDIYPRALEETKMTFPELYSVTPTRLNTSILSTYANAISSFFNPFDNMRWTMGATNTSTASMSIIDNNSHKQKYAYMQQAMIYG